MTTYTLKKILMAVSAILVPAIAISQEITDTVAARVLDEVVIEAPKVIRKSDMDVFIPSRSAVDNSRNGLQLLSNLMIPSLTVTEALGSVKAAGQTVQIRINGRVATVEQVKALLPSTIRRIEWSDNPGLRYNGANYVLNVIVANPTLGGSLQLEGRQALNEAWGEYFADSKFNFGRSQFEIGSMFKLTDNVSVHRDYKESFTYPDEIVISRTESPLGGDVDNNFGRLWSAWSYIRPDSTTIYVQASVDPTFSDRLTTIGRLSLSDGSNEIYLTDSHGNHGSTSHLSAYFEHNFSHRQTLVVDFNSSFYFGKSYSDYVESLSPATPSLTDIHTHIKDRNQAYAVEADYIKKWRSSRLTVGASYSANRNRSVYENLGGEIFHQRLDKAYFFAEYLRTVGKVSFTAGIGMQYTDYLFKETAQGNHSWNFRPQATVTYRVNPLHQLQLSFQSWQSTPSLAESNIAPQQIDGFQWQIGNPDLRTANSYRLTLRYDFTLPFSTGSLGVRAYSSPDAITPCLYWDNDRLITSYENSRGLQNLSFFLSPQIEIIPDWMMVSGYLQYRIERMRGSDYVHHNRNWSGNASLMLAHWGFELVGQYVCAQHDLWGEKISWSENLSIIQLIYNWKKWQFGAGIIMPFGKYDQGSKMLSHWNTNEQHMRLDMRMPYVSVSYNIQWGRQKRGARKLISSDATVSTSTPATR